MIDWLPMETADHDADEVLLAVPNLLGTASGGDGIKLNPRWPVLYYLATWDGAHGKWRTSETAFEDSVYLEPKEPLSWARFNPPTWATEEGR